MNRKLTVATLAAAALFSAAPRPANAQDTGLIPVRVKIGALYPASSGTRTATGDFHLGGEVDVALPKIFGGKYIASLGFSQGSDGGGKLRTIPLTLGRYFQLPNPAKKITGTVYSGVGLGAYFVKGTVGAVSDSKVVPGGYGVVGYQFPNPYFVEAKYSIAGKVNGLKPGGLALMVGRRF